MSLNKMLLIGNVGKDAAYIGQSGKAVKFSIGYTDKYTNKSTGEVRETTTWFEVMVFTQIDSAVDNIKKGCKVFVEGEVSLNKYTGTDGVERASVQLKAFDWRVLAPPRGTQPGSPPVAQRNASNAPPRGGHVDPAQQAGAGGDEFDDSIPFS